jgi:hypothetical protein
MRPPARGKGHREYVATAAIVFVITFLMGLMRSKGVTREMIVDCLASSAALSLGLFAGRALWRRFG